MKKTALGALGLAGLLGGVATVADRSSAADHLEAPLVAEDGRTDINDLYLFVNGDRTTMVMTVNPAAGVLSPTTFSPDGQYRFMIDTDNDLKAEVRYRVTFGEPDSTGAQDVSVKGNGGWKASGRTEETIEADGARMTAATFDDPFFFDLEGFLGTVKGQGTRGFCDGQEVDFFAGLNVSAIVLEVPTTWLTDGDDPVVKVWAETTDADGRVDRMGKPAIATVLIDDGNEDAFNATRPHQDVKKWSAEVSANLQALSGLDGDGYDQSTADFVTSLLLPDVLTLDTTSSAGFVDGPLNGRQPHEDVIDFELAVVTGLFDAGGNGPVLTTDCVDANNVPYPADFPYLAPANS